MLIWAPRKEVLREGEREREGGGERGREREREDPSLQKSAVLQNMMSLFTMEM